MRKPNLGKIIKKAHEYEYFYECEDGDIIRDGRKFRKGKAIAPAIYEYEIALEEAAHQSAEDGY